jgi:hypothetical protein
MRGSSPTRRSRSASLGCVSWREPGALRQAREDRDVRGIDVIGDVHGHADRLISLLESLGYAERSRRGPMAAAQRCSSAI